MGLGGLGIGAPPWACDRCECYDIVYSDTKALYGGLGCPKHLFEIWPWLSS